MRWSPAPPSWRSPARRAATFGVALLALSAAVPSYSAQVVEPPEPGTRQVPTTAPPPPTVPVALELAVQLAADDLCAPIYHAGPWRVDLVCLDSVPLWRVQGPFRGGEIRSQVALPEAGWTRITVRSDGVHTAELYVNGEDVRNLASTFSTWPAAWRGTRKSGSG